MALFVQSIQAQDEAAFEIVEADTIMVDTSLAEHSPMKAAMLSAVLPGLGQVYNRRYWKLPLVYGGLGGFGYGAIWNSREYNFYFDIYRFMTENGLDEHEGRSLREVEWYKDTHLRYKNLMIILAVGFYAIQIVDASVDAHLFDYDISEDLSFTVDPVLIEPSPYRANLHATGSAAFGFRCCLSF